jgi:hypothetical protein
MTSSAYDVGFIESWIEAPRFMLPSGFIEEGVMLVNSMMRRKRLDYMPLEIVYVDERQGWFSRRIFFKVRGQRVPLTTFKQLFDDAVERAA